LGIGIYLAIAIYLDMWISWDIGRYLILDRELGENERELRETGRELREN